MMNPESIYYLFEDGHEGKHGGYIWPIPGIATPFDKVFIVCDGAGSFDNGGIASKLICQFMAAKVLKFVEGKMSGELINKLLIEARDRLIFYARQCRLDTDLATTFSMIILYDQRVLMSWYGNSRIYHLREGEILFRTEGNSLVIKTDSSPIYAETKWIEDVQDGDYFLLCSKGLLENVTDEDIQSLLSQNDNASIDLAKSFKQSIEKTLGNCSMYLIRVNLGTQKRSINSGIIASKKHTSTIMAPILIFAMVIIGLLNIFFYFRKARTSDSAPEYTNQTTRPMDFKHYDSIRGARSKSKSLKAIDTVTDSVKSDSESPEAIPQNDNSTDIQTGEKPEQTNQPSKSQKRPGAQLLIKLSTDESCKLKITNIDLDEVIDWDLSQNDNGTIYLKPGKYSIVATSVTNSAKTKTYNFDVKPENANTMQNLHITF
ncbi:MAG TPA: protein phosphatase 2C domain-containing protein [Puia sp.]|jgi:serine/threonine protein phosphatase PrpC|nr:protein phosphatase 2C domain-containing protein [Puia sp.]